MPVIARHGLIPHALRIRKLLRGAPIRSVIFRIFFSYLSFIFVPLNPFSELLYLSAAFPHTDSFKVRQFAGRQLEIHVGVLGLLTSGFPASAFSGAAAFGFVGHCQKFPVS